MRKMVAILALFVLSMTIAACTGEQSITVVFETNGGNEISDMTINITDTSIELPTPVREGHTFDGWYINEDLTDPFSIASFLTTATITVYAKWIVNTYTITFNSNGGSLITAITQDYDTVVTAPADPTRAGYTFAGWHEDEALSSAYTFTTMPAENITLYAKWDEAGPVTTTISFEVDGGSMVADITQDSGSVVIEPTAPTKAGYTFAGWYTEPEFINEYVFTIMPVEDLVLYAKWQINQHGVSYYIYENDDPTAAITLHPDETIISVSLGTHHSSALTSSGRVFTWGRNDYGQLGDGTIMQRTVPTEITSRFNLAAGETIVSISLEYAHSSALTSSGRMFTWGWNSSGQLGDGTTTNRSTPTDITDQFDLAAGETVVSVSLGDSHSSALTSSGRMFTWGWNSSGQLGDETTTSRTTPTEITHHFDLEAGETIVSISLGYAHSSALTSSGRMFTWGDNGYGQLGDGTESYRHTPTEVTDQFDLVAGETIASISLGSWHSSALTSSGSVFTWGYNGDGQLGDGTTTWRTTPTEMTHQFNLAAGETIVNVSSGGEHTSALTSQGRAFTWGYNSYGQLGDDTTTDKSTPTEITHQFNLETGETIVSISLGYHYSSALTSQGRMFTWGRNNYGQLGDWTTSHRSTPTEIRTRYLILILTETYDHGSPITEYTPTKEGHVFSGWYTDIDMTTPYVFETMAAEDVMLYGYWTAID